MACVACHNLGPLASPPSSFFLFFPKYEYKGKTRVTTSATTKSSSVSNDTTNRSQLCQVIYSGKGQMNFLLQKPTFKPYIHCIEGKCNKVGCIYKHCLFPRDFDKANCLVMS